MDLPSCPACGQSVLDEGIDHCPFCGASMSGDGSSIPGAPPAVAPLSATPTSETPAPTATPETPAPAVTPAPAASITDKDDDDPFAVDLSVTHLGIPAAAKPSRQRPLRVICPMCDTQGFLPRKAAGRDVKCANPDCLVPIFTAPAPDRTAGRAEESAETSTPSGGGRGVLIVSLLLLLAVVGIGAWWFLSDPATAPTTAEGSTDGSLPSFGTVDRPPVEKPPAKAAEVRTAVPARMSIQQVLAQSADVLVTAAQQREENRSKPFCRRLTAEFFARQGLEKETRRELVQLTQVGADVPHLHVTPLVSLWWTRQGKNPPRLGPDLQLAVQQSAGLSPRDPYAVNAAVALGVALVASGQDDIARQIIDRLWYEDAPQRLRLQLLQAELLRSHSLADEALMRPIMPRSRSLDTVIIEGLVMRAQESRAADWARRTREPLARADRLAAWATVLLRVGESKTLETIREVLDSEPPLLQARVLARVAVIASLRNDKATMTQAAAAAATAALDRCPAPRKVVLGDLVQTYRLPVDENVAGWWLQAEAATALAAARTVAGDLDAGQFAWKRALAAARAIGPALPDAQAKLAAVTATGAAAFRNRLKDALELASDDDARQAADVYKRKAAAWVGLARQRTACLQNIHRWAADWKLLEAVWRDVKTFGTAQEVSRRDPFHTSTLPWFLYLRFQEAKNEEAMKDIRDTVPRSAPVDHDELLRLKTLKLAGDARIDLCLQAISADAASRPKRPARFARRRVMLGMVDKLISLGRVTEALSLIAGFRDPRLAIWREDAYQYVGGALALGNHHEAWQHAMAKQRTPTERIALLAGLANALLPQRALSAAGTEE